MTRARRFFRRVDVRLTLWFTTIMLFSALLLFGFTFLNLFQTLRAQDRRQLQGRAAAYVLPYRAAVSEAAGITLLVNQLSNDILEPTDKPFFARIANNANQQIFLAIPLIEWQSIDVSPLVSGPDLHDEGFLSIAAPELGYELEILAIRISNEYILQIGSDTRNRVQTLRAFQTGFLFTFALMLGISLAGGLFFASRSLRPISALNTTVRSIITTGELSRRIPARQSNDDLDEMIHSVNLMLDRIGSLVDGLRDALDAVAHDLRTPLTRFRSTAERALSGPPDPHHYREALSDALEESEHILGMLNAMMDISEAESGAMTLHRQPVDIRALSRDVAEVYSVVADEARMTIVVEDGAPLEAAADPARMRQVIGNLLDNAVKYGTDGSLVRVTGAVRRDEGRVELSVCNTGLPIPGPELDRIWNRLYRGPGATDRRDGLGLGLALVRAVVSAHGGSATVASNEDETRFTISIPAAPAPANITEV